MSGRHGLTGMVSASSAYSKKLAEVNRYRGTSSVLKQKVSANGCSYVVTIDKIAGFLVESVPDHTIDKRVKVYCNRLMLRMFSQPSLMSFLSDASIYKPDPNGDKVVMEMDFMRLPEEVIEPMIRLIAAPRTPKLFAFEKNGAARTGVKIDLEPKDFPGDYLDYAN